jgi:predicted alpha/beta-fold hydrolase
MPDRPGQLVVRVAPGSAVRLAIDRPARTERGTLLLIHGMCGSSESGYMRRTSIQATRRGWVVARMNLRTCGGTEALSSTLYNAGQSEDAGRVLAELERLRFPRPHVAVGFSLGGNIVLLYAGREGAASRADAVAAINPPVDLEQCARALERPENRLYQAHYTRRLCRDLRRIARHRPLPGPRLSRRRVGTLRRFDTLYTAPDGGYPSAEVYYAEASAAPHLARIDRPALIISAANDPIVPPGIFARHRDAACVRILTPSAGGHCGYWQADRPRFWAAKEILDRLDA